MDRLFGKSSKPTADPSESLSSTTKKLDTRTSELDAKIRDADRELMELKTKMASVPEGPVKNGLKQKALNILKRKKVLETHRDSTMNQSLSVIQADMTLDTIRNTVNVYNTMAIASKEIKKQIKVVDMSKLEVRAVVFWLFL